MSNWKPTVNNKEQMKVVDRLFKLCYNESILNRINWVIKKRNEITKKD